MVVGRKRIDLTGVRVGQAVALEPLPADLGGTKWRTQWLMQCDCGQQFAARTYAIRERQPSAMNCGGIRHKQPHGTLKHITVPSVPPARPNPAIEFQQWMAGLEAEFKMWLHSKEAELRRRFLKSKAKV